MTQAAGNNGTVGAIEAFSEVLSGSRKVYEAGLDYMGRASELITKEMGAQQAELLNETAGFGEKLASFTANLGNFNTVSGQNRIAAEVLEQHKKAIQGLADYALDAQARKTEVVQGLWSFGTKIIPAIEELQKSVVRYGSALFNWPVETEKSAS